jgi:hypothetical protein
LVLVDFAALYHKARLLHQSNVIQRVARHCNNVGLLAGLKASMHFTNFQKISGIPPFTVDANSCCDRYSSKIEEFRRL